MQKLNFTKKNQLRFPCKARSLFKFTALPIQKIKFTTSIKTLSFILLVLMQLSFRKADTQQPAQTVIVGWQEPNSWELTDNASYWWNPKADKGVAANVGVSIMRTFGGVSHASSSSWFTDNNQVLYNVNPAIDPGTQTWANGNGTKGWVCNFSTVGFSTLVFSVKMSATFNTSISWVGPRDFKLQFSLNNSTWTDVSGATIAAAKDNSEAALNATSLINVSLPASCENQAAVYLRLLMNSNTNVNGGTVAGGYSIVDDFIVSGNAAATTPTVTTQAVNSITETTATGNGNVTALGSANPTTHGHVWSTSSGPTVSLSTKTSLGAKSSTGAFTSNITSLLASTTYFVKAYATNASGTSYGSEVSFITDAACAAPTAQATAFTFGSGGSSSSTQITGFTAPVSGADGYVIYANSTNSFTAPSNSSTALTANTTYGSGQQCIYFNTNIPSNLMVGGLNASTTYYYKVYAYKNCLGTYTYETSGLGSSETTAIAPPAAAGTITGTPSVCAGSNSVSYGVGTISGSSSYLWSYSGTGVIINNSTSNNVTLNFAANATGGNLTVKGHNTSGDGTVSADYSIAVNPLPLAAGSISGPSTFEIDVSSTGHAYSLPAVNNATDYTWTYSGTGATINNSATNNITIDFAANATMGALTVKGHNTCGYGVVSMAYPLTYPLLSANALRFDGSDDIVSNTSVFTTAPTAFTMEWWMKPASLSNYNQVIGAKVGWTAFKFHTTSSGAVYTGMDGGADRFSPVELPAGTLVLNEWQHFAFTYGAGIGSIFKNGVLLASKAMKAPLAWNGVSFGEANNTVSGGLDEVRVWNVARTANQIADNLNKTLSGNETGLVAYYTFNQGIPAGINTGLTSLLDKTTNGKNATLSNFTLSGSNSNWVTSFAPIFYDLSVPAPAGAILGSDVACINTTEVAYNVSTIAGATSYIWSYTGTGVTINNASTNKVSLNFAANATGGDLTVKGHNELGDGLVSANFAITVKSIPASLSFTPSASSVCPGTTISASVTPVGDNATTWVYTTSGTAPTLVNPSTASVSFTPISYLQSGTLKVSASNICGTSEPTSASITVLPLVAAAGSITGSEIVDPLQTAVAYSVASISDANYYIWSYTGTGATINNSTTNSININFSANATNGTLTVKGHNTCGDGTISPDFGVKVNALWKGVTSTNWHTASNWTANLVPTAAENVKIVPRMTFLPVIKAGLLAECNNLQINNGSALQVEAGGALTIHGKLVNNAGLLTLKSGTGNTPTGSLIIKGTQTSTGILRAERYLTTVVSNIHSVSSPFMTANKTILGTTAEQFNPATVAYELVNTSTITPGRGYFTYDVDVNKIFSGGLFNSGTIVLMTTSGSLKNSLAGNPFPSAIDWDAVSGWNRTNIAPNIAVRNDGSYATYNSATGLATKGGSRYIAAMQGFMLRTSGVNSVITIDNQACVHNNQVFLKSEKITGNLLRLSADGAGSVADEAVVSFNPLADAAFEDLDNPKYFESEANFAHIFTKSSDGENLAVNSLKAQNTIPLYFSCGVSGSYSIKATELNFDQYSKVYLEDKFLNKVSDLTSGSYSFNYQSGSSNARFMLHFGNENGVENAEITIYSYENRIYVNNTLVENVNVSIYDLSGRLVKQANGLASGIHTIDMSGAATGIYTVSVNGKTAKVVIN